MTAIIAFMGSLMAVMFVLAMLRIGELTKENQALRAQLSKKPRAPRTVADKYRKAIETHKTASTHPEAGVYGTPEDWELWAVLPQSPADAS